MGDIRNGVCGGVYPPLYRNSHTPFNNGDEVHGCGDDDDDDCATIVFSNLTINSVIVLRVSISVSKLLFRIKLLVGNSSNIFVIIPVVVVGRLELVVTVFVSLSVSSSLSKSFIVDVAAVYPCSLKSSLSSSKDAESDGALLMDNNDDDDDDDDDDDFGQSLLRSSRFWLLWRRVGVYEVENPFTMKYE